MPLLKAYPIVKIILEVVQLAKLSMKKEKKKLWWTQLIQYKKST